MIPTSSGFPLAVVLDDDPTGTQCASDVTVLLDWTVDDIVDELHRARERGRPALFLQTDSRALTEPAARALAERIRDELAEAEVRLGATIRVVLRGDSTLRGHVIAESEVFLAPGGVVVFVPSFPAGGRITRDGVHTARIGGVDVPVGETEFARDPVFGFRSSRLVDFLAERTRRRAVAVPLETVRAGGLAAALADAPDGAVVVPDAIDDDDVRAIAAAVRAAQGTRPVTVRCAAPLAAELAGVAGHGFVAPRERVAGGVLLAVGSHTDAATAQLGGIADAPPAVFLDADDAIADPVAAGRAAAARAEPLLRAGGLAIVATARTRRAEHGTLDHGERLMSALTTAVRELLPATDLVIAKGGITSAEVARTGLGARSAVVVGQLEPGVSLWRLRAVDGRELDYVVVPGNVGDDGLLARLVATALG